MYLSGGQYDHQLVKDWAMEDRQVRWTQSSSWPSRAFLIFCSYRKGGILARVNYQDNDNQGKTHWKFVYLVKPLFPLLSWVELGDMETKCGPSKAYTMWGTWKFSWLLVNCNIWKPTRTKLCLNKVRPLLDLEYSCLFSLRVYRNYWFCDLLGSLNQRTKVS